MVMLPVYHFRHFLETINDETLYVPYPSHEMKAHRVSRSVNKVSPKNLWMYASSR